MDLTNYVSISKMLKYSDVLFTDSNDLPINGDIVAEEGIIRFTSGKLGHSELPSFEAEEYQLEYYSNGKLHNKKGEPAVMGYSGDYYIEEYWSEGVLIDVKKELIDED